MEEYKIHQDLLNENVEGLSCRLLLHKMKDSHIISDPILLQNSVIINKHDDEVCCSFDNSAQFQHPCFPNKQSDVIKVLLDLDRAVSETEPSWNELVQKQNFNFQDFLFQ